MTRITQIYENNDKLSNFLDSISFNYSSECLVKIFTTNLPQDECLKLAQYIKTLIPNSHIIGATSSSAVIIDGKQHENATLLMIEQYDSLQIQVEKFTFKESTPKSLASEVHSKFSKATQKEQPLVHILFSDLYPEIHQFIEESNLLSPIVKLTGGITGYDHVSTQAGFVFTEEGIIENGAIAFSTYSENVVNFIKPTCSMETISDPFTITETNGEVITSIENIDAITWMRNFLNIDINTEYTLEDWKTKANDDFLVHFPIMIEDMPGAGRYTQYNKESNSLSTYFSKLTSNTRFRMGYVNPTKTIKEIFELCSEVIDSPIESIFAYSCLFRKLYIKNCAEWELTPFNNHNVCGIFMLGEIAFSEDKNIFYNGAFVFTGLAESEKYIIPEMSALEKISTIYEDGSFLEKAKSKGKEYMKTKLSLINAITSADLQLKENIDKNLQTYTMYQYELDVKDKDKGNICVIEVLTADTHIAFVGQDKYYEACSKMLVELNAYLEEYNILIYSINHKNFLLACKYEFNDKEFISIMKKVYRKFEYTIIKDTELTFVSRFAVVVNQKNKLNKALNLLISATNIQENFLISLGENEKRNTYNDDTKMIDIITRSIKNNSIVPYYQGIYNNKTNKIDKYEALMRIIDTDETVYNPDSFLDIARKYKLYYKCSTQLIKKVLDDFKDKEESVSINISLDDIQSRNFRNWFISQIKYYPNAHNIIIEFVENENYERLDELYEFVKILRGYGIKIAIDDFGTGYSNFSTIIALKPDFIKIDGSIIKNIFNDNNNILLIDTIKYIAHKMNSKIIAEFVDNEKTQDFIQGTDLDFSQGYYFSVPCALEKSRR